MRSVLHAALVPPNGYNGNTFQNAFFDNGFVDYRMFDYQLERFQYGIEGMRRKLVQQAEAYRPELIFLHVQNSELLDIETVKKLSSVGFTVLYTYDVRSKEKTEWMYELAPHLGLVCFACEEDVLHCKSLGMSNCFVLQSSADMDVYKQYPIIKSGGKISFVGTNYIDTNLDFPLSKERTDMVGILEKDYPDNFKAYGIGWKESKLTNPQQEVNIYNNSVIAINQNNFDRENYTSDRLWRIMASGTFCLTKHFKGIESIFQNGVHLSWWEDFDQLRWQLKYYLENEKQRERIAAFGSKFVRNNHSWSDRIKQLMNVVERQRRIINSPCLDAHKIKGKIPNDADTELNGLPCDCGKLRGVFEECGCDNKTIQFRWQQNIQ